MSSFYWHSKVDNGNTLKGELLGLDTVNMVKIASAYFSNEGLEILEEFKDNIENDRFFRAFVGTACCSFL